MSSRDRTKSVAMTTLFGKCGGGGAKVDVLTVGVGKVLDIYKEVVRKENLEQALNKLFAERGLLTLSGYAS